MSTNGTYTPTFGGNAMGNNMGMNMDQQMQSYNVMQNMQAHNAQQGMQQQKFPTNYGNSGNPLSGTPIGLANNFAGNTLFKPMGSKAPSQTLSQNLSSANTQVPGIKQSSSMLIITQYVNNEMKKSASAKQASQLTDAWRSMPQTAQNVLNPTLPIAGSTLAVLYALAKGNPRNKSLPRSERLKSLLGAAVAGGGAGLGANAILEFGPKVLDHVDYKETYKPPKPKEKATGPITGYGGTPDERSTLQWGYEKLYPYIFGK